MPSGPFAHVCLMVKDLDQAVQDWEIILAELDPGQLEERTVRYDEFSGGDDAMRWATFVSAHGAEIQLMEPAPGTPLHRRLQKHGEGVHHVCFTTDNPEAAIKRLSEQGLAVGEETYSDPDTPWQRWGWILPKSGHGTLVEVARPYRAVDGKWQSGSPTAA